MKKALCFALLLSLCIVSLSALAAVAADPSPFNQKMVIANVPKSVGGAWYTRMFQGFGQYSGMTGSETFQIGPSVGDAAAQNRNIQDVIAQGVDVICVNPFAPEQIDADLKKAMDAGIIVIANEGDILKNVHYDIEAFDNGLFGAQAADLLHQGMGGKGEIIIFVGSLASTAHVGWAQGIVDAIGAKYPELKVANAGGVFIETGNNAANSYEKAKEAIKAYPNATGIFCPSATDTPSIARAIEEAGLTEKITYVAVGLPNATRTYVNNGAINWLMSWDPADIGLAMCKAAGAVKAGVEIKDGDDLGVFGYSKVKVTGKVVKGNEWRVITKEDIGKYNY